MDATLTTGLTVAAGVGLVGTAFRSRRHWGEPGAKPFTALTATLGVAGLGLAARSVDPRAGLVSIPLLYSVVPVLWAVFAFEFTGRYDVAGPRRRLLLAAPAAFEIVGFVGFTLAASELVGAPATSTGTNVWYLVVTSASGPAQAILTAVYAGLFVAMFYLFGLMLMATAVLIGHLVRYDHLGPRVALLLSVGVVGPWLTMMVGDTVAASTNLGSGSIRLSVAMTFVVAAAGIATALERYDLFAVAPAAGTVGPERVLQDLSEPIVVVDHDERVTRLNPAARRVFGTDRRHVGNAIADLVGHDVASLRNATSLDVDGVDGHHHYEARVSEMAGERGRVRGHTVVLRDVTEREVRQQRLEVLNRVLRHNLRNDLTAIRGRAEMLGTGDADENVVREVITETADDLVALSDRAREVEQMLSVPVAESQTSDLSAVVSAVVGEVAAEYDAAIAVSVPEGITVGADARILRPIVYNLVVNAIRHHDRTDPAIEVSATVGDGSLPVTLRVTDDGPGLPEHERIAVERGHENPLEHGSGLGLWAIKWGVTRIGGHLTIRDNEPRGTVVEIHLPTRDSTDAPEARETAETGDRTAVPEEANAGEPVGPRSGDTGIPGDGAGTGQ